MMPRRPGNEEEPKPVERMDKIAWRPAFKVNEKTPQSQVTGALSFNEMRQWIIDHGGMEEK